MSRPLPRYRHDHDQEERGLGQRAIRDGRRVPRPAWWDGRAGASAFDAQRLRGIPAIGPSVAGVITDENELHSLMAQRPDYGNA